jgi:hypothetical protein
MPITMMTKYPKGADVDVDHYINKYSPPTWEAMKPFGLSNIRCLVPKGPDDKYELIAMGDFPSWEAFEKMQASIPPETWQKWTEDLKSCSKIMPEASVLEVKDLGEHQI